MDTSKKIIGALVKLHRLNIGLTQRELADILRVDKQYVRKIEHGKINLTMDYLDKLINKLGIEYEDFFRGLGMNSFIMSFFLK